MPNVGNAVEGVLDATGGGRGEGGRQGQLGDGVSQASSRSETQAQVPLQLLVRQQQHIAERHLLLDEARVVVVQSQRPQQHQESIRVVVGRIGYYSVFLFLFLFPDLALLMCPRRGLVRSLLFLSFGFGVSGQPLHDKRLVFPRSFLFGYRDLQWMTIVFEDDGNLCLLILACFGRFVDL